MRDTFARAPPGTSQCGRTSFTHEHVPSRLRCTFVRAWEGSGEVFHHTTTHRTTPASLLRLQTCLPCSTWAAPPDAVALLASAAADWRTPGCAFAILRGYSWYVEVGNADCFLSCYPEQHSLQHYGASSCRSSGRGEQHLGSTTDESCCCATYFAGCALRVCLSVRGFLNSAWHIDRAPARGLALTGRTASRAGLEPLAGRQTGR